METRQLRRTLKIFLAFLMALRFIRGIPPDRLDLHKVMTRKEMIKYLDVHSQDDVPEYEIASLAPRRNRRSTEQHDGVKFSAFQNSFDIKLKPSNEFISPSLVVDKRHKDGRLTREVYKPRGHFYHGELASNKNSFAAVRDKENKGKLSGTIIHDNYIYKVEPLPNHLSAHVKTGNQDLHIISRRSMRSGKTKRSQPVKVPLEEYIGEKVRAKRSDQELLGPKWIEAMILADNTTVSYYGDETMDYVLSIANLVNRLFQDPSLGVNVTFALVKVVLVDGFEPELDFVKNKIDSASDYLNKFEHWAKKRNPHVENAQHWDNAVLLTRRMCGLRNCYLDGLAYFGVPCQPSLGVSVNDAHGLGAALSVAHEVAHNLNVNHDRGNCRGGSIMSAVAASNINAFIWSNCSRKAMRNTMRKVSCYDDRPSSNLEVPKKPAGVRWTADRQCQMKYGPGVRECWMTTGRCHDSLLCTRGTNCFGRGHPPADGTKCGLGKWCIRGRCVSDGTTRPPPIDGSWGPWQNFSACSRTCGGGIRYRKRLCNNPSPQNGGKRCPGESKGYYEMCNLMECPEKRSYRQEQCASFNSNTTKFWDYFKTSDPCLRTCRVKNHVYIKGVFNDGTPCSRDQAADLRCVNGKCQAFHCDGKQRKAWSRIAVRDRCKVCNGRGDRCRRVYGRFTREWKYWGPSEATVMLRIPAGATNVKIVEDKMSNNLLNLKTDPPKRSNFVIGVISGSTVIPFAGTMVYYHRMNQPKERILYQENITIAGPTNQPLNVMYIWIGPEGNPGFTYSYYAPTNSSDVPNPIIAFKWKYSTDPRCTATCAGGTRQRRVTCHRVDDDTEVSIRHCNPSTRPSDTEMCNNQPCPPQWQIGSWTPCSQTCGGGSRVRTVKCVRQYNQNGGVQVEVDSLCAAVPKPNGVQECNQIDCAPEWETGNWSECSAVCDGGGQHRTLKCKQRLRNGSMVEQALGKCRNYTGITVSAQRNCNTQRCLYHWVVKYNCDECRAGYKHVGCYKDRRYRAIPKLLGFYRSAELLKKCAEVARSDGYNTFGAEYSKECWSGPRANETYNKYGPSHNCKNGVGGAWANDVYFLVDDTISIVQCQHKESSRTFSSKYCHNEGHRRPVVPEKRLCNEVCHSAKVCGDDC